MGIIGIGSHGYRNILPLMNYLPVKVKAVCNRTADVGRITAAQYGCAHYQTPREMYDQEEIDAVFINVSPQLHPSLVIEALDRGKHVWVEKPVATRARDVEEMIAHRKDRVVVVGFKKIFMPAAQKAIEIAYSPKYGNLRSLLAVYPMTIPGNGREILDAGNAPNWLINGVHPLSFLMAVGGKVSAVTAICNDARNGILALQFATVPSARCIWLPGRSPGWNATRYMRTTGSWISKIPGLPFIEASRLSTAKRRTTRRRGMTAAPLSGKLRTVRPVWRTRPSSPRACTLP